MTNETVAPQGSPGDIINWPMLKLVYRTDPDKIAALLDVVDIQSCTQLL